MLRVPPLRRAIANRRVLPVPRLFAAMNSHDSSQTVSQTSAKDPADPSNSKRIFAPGTAHSSSQAEQYTRGSLSLSDLSPDPLSQFHTWFTHAQGHSVHQPETVCLSTASLPSGRVSARMVYLKELDGRGFVIYSNWGTSRKAADIASNGSAALTFWWRELERQVRVEGTAERLSDEESQVYFDTRIRGSRIGAWASEQSKVLKNGSREELEERVQEVEQRFDGQERIPVPGFWGGIRVVPDAMEFWQGRESRLHDRFRYERAVEEGWTVERLSP